MYVYAYIHMCVLYASVNPFSVAIFTCTHVEIYKTIILKGKLARKVHIYVMKYLFYIRSNLPLFSQILFMTQI